MNFVPSLDPFALLSAGHYRIVKVTRQAVPGPNAIIWPFDIPSDPKRLLLATPAELSEFLKSVEKRAFKRTTYHVRNDESALDIVQDSMMKLAEHYGQKPAEELPMLFQRILSNTTLDWFRRQKVKNALFSSFSDFHSAEEDDEFDILDSVSTAEVAAGFDNPENEHQRTQTFNLIEQALLLLPNRQREAFLMRYWEDMDVSETASAMGCSEGSVKTHCSRAVQALSKALSSKAVK
jgi:RNA polymerase sigma-70 factor (ECF subfamily)